MNSQKNEPQLTQDSRITAHTQLPTLGTVASILAILFLVYAFFSGLSLQFYASFLFGFYALTQSMWVSVMLLGVFQTLLLIPFRMVRIIKSNHITEFQKTIEQIKSQREQGFILKQRFHQGNRAFLFYAVDFIMQLVSYISIGRLFLTDFYSRTLDPNLLYSWIPYPEYPLENIFFKLPYPAATRTIDFGWQTVIIVWIVLIIIQMGIYTMQRTIRRQHGEGALKKLFENRFMRYTTGYLIGFMFLAWILVRHFPVDWDMKIFSGDISIPNRTFNTVTAIATFAVLVYHGIPKIARKGRLAEKHGLEESVIEQTQMQMLKDLIFTAGMVGLGAFFITNQIPSAFELSIFTLEVISLAAPFTIDRLVLKNLPFKKDEVIADTPPAPPATGAKASSETEAEPAKPAA